MPGAFGGGMTVERVDMMSKKALVILSSPKTLVDFMWYYTEYGQEFEWDVLIHKEFILSQNHLEKTGIFQHIYLDETNLLQKNRIALAGIFAEMVFYKAIGRQEVYAEKTLKKLTEGKVYDLYIVAPYLFTLLPGLVYLMGKKHDVVILEDGNADFSKHPNKWLKSNPQNMLYYASYVLGKMGYADLTNQYDLKSRGYCTKCSSFPEKMEFTGYKQVLEIGVFTGTNRQKYDELINKTFSLDITNNAAAVLYTTPISSLTDDSLLASRLIAKTEQYINDHYRGKMILLKKHPRDKAEYKFDAEVKLMIIDPVIPGEMLVDHLAKHGNHKNIFMYTSSVIQHLDDSNYIVLYYSDLDSPETRKERTLYAANFSFDVEKWAIKEQNIVVI